MNRSEGTYAWVILAGWVASYDLWAIRTNHQTLSSAFYEAVRHPRRRWLVIVSWALLTGHLFGLGKYRWDDIRLALVRKGQRG